MEQFILLLCPLQRGCSQHPASNCLWLFYTYLSCAHSLHFAELSLCLPLHSWCVRRATILPLGLRVGRFKKLSASCLALLNSLKAFLPPYSFSSPPVHSKKINFKYTAQTRGGVGDKTSRCSLGSQQASGPTWNQENGLGKKQQQNWGLKKHFEIWAAWESEAWNCKITHLACPAVCMESPVSIYDIRGLIKYFVL